MSNFDEKSGVVYCKTSWGQWGQTIEEVFIEIDIPESANVRGRDVNCDIKTTSIAVSIRGEVKLKGKLSGTVDGCLLRIVLAKSHRDASNCWRSLLEGEYEPNAWEWDQMEKKLTLERFQTENPGMDFSGADITGNYHGGGPKLK